LYTIKAEIEQKMPKISIEITEHEDAVLKAHCKRFSQTKTAILREYIRSLAPDTQWLPKGWVEDAVDGKIKGTYKEYWVTLNPNAEGYEWIAINCWTNRLLIPPEGKTFENLGDDPYMAISRVQYILDDIANLSH
jgi:hypothetical protein